MDINNKETLRVLLVVEVDYDRDQYPTADAVAEEVRFIVDNATDPQWDEFVHITSVPVVRTDGRCERCSNITDDEVVLSYEEVSR